MSRKPSNRRSFQSYQPLEPRQLLASIAFNVGEVVVRGDATADMIQLIGNANYQSFTVSINDDTSLTESFDYSDVTKLTVFAGAGNDRVTNSLLMDTIIYGGDGNDLLQGGFLNDVLYGGNGGDRLIGRNGDDTLRGDGGVDVMYGGNGADRIYGFAGNDQAFGGNGDDFIVGGNGDDRIAGNGGDDTLNGNAGKDTIFAGLGADSVSGGLDEDSIYGVGGDNSINGNAGDDTIYGGAGDDIVSGGSGDDSILALTEPMISTAKQATTRSTVEPAPMISMVVLVMIFWPVGWVRIESKDVPESMSCTVVPMTTSCWGETETTFSMVKRATTI